MLQKGGMMSHLRSPRRRAAAGFAAISTGLAVAAVAFASPAAATWEPDKTRVPGNPSCEDLGYENSFKIEANGELPESGTYTAGSPGVETVGDADGFEVDIEIGSHLGRVVVEFESNNPVDVVVIKAGNEAYVYYENSDPVTESAQHHYLKSPKRDSISHITFCWNGDEETPPTTEPEEETPPTTEPEHEHPTTTVPDDEPDDEDDEDEDDDDEEEAPVAQTPPAPAVSGSPILTG